MKRIYLMYEIENRELESRIYMAQQLLRADCEVTIFQHSVLWLIALFSKPGIICLKSTPYQFDSAISILKQRGFKIVAWQEEGLHHFHGQPESPVFSKNSAQQIDHYFAWHPADAQFAVGTGVNPASIETVGNVRFEILASSSTFPVPLSDKQNRILILTNFDKTRMSYDFNLDPNMGDEGKLLAETFWSFEQKAAEENRVLYQELFARLAKKPSLKPRVRLYFYEIDSPHTQFGLPSDTYVTISESLRNCDLLIHYGSTGGVEAASLGIPNLILASTPNGIDERILKSSSFFSTVDSLFAEMEVVLDSTQHARELTNSQHKSQVDAYEFDLRKSNHVAGLITYIDTVELPESAEIVFFERLKLGISFTLIRLKYNSRRFFSSTNMTKASKINDKSLCKEIWNPVKDFLSGSSTFFLGRAIHLSNNKRAS